MLHDDGYGVDESLNETAHGKGLIARGKLLLVFGPKAPSIEGTERFLQLEQLLPGLLLFSNVSQFDYDDWRVAYNHIHSALSLTLPKNVNILTFEPWKKNSFLIRFEHILAVYEDEQYSQEVSFDFKDVFRSFDIVGVRETTLAANQWLSESKPLKFIAKTTDPNRIKKTVFSSRTSSRNCNDDFLITLKPMEMRTFIVELKWRPKVKPFRAF